MVLASPGSLSKLSSSVRQNTPSRPAHVWWGVYHVWWGIYHRGMHTETSDSAPIWPPHRLFIIISTHITMNMHAHTYKHANYSQTMGS